MNLTRRVRVYPNTNIDEGTQKWLTQGREEEAHMRWPQRPKDWLYRHYITRGATEKEARKQQILYNEACATFEIHCPEWDACMAHRRELDKKYPIN